MKRVGIFGSFARGEQTRKSDIDVIVEFIPGHETFTNHIHLVDFLEALFQRDVDLLTEPSLSELIRPYIEKDVIWIEGCSRPPDTYLEGNGVYQEDLPGPQFR